MFQKNKEQRIIRLTNECAEVRDRLKISKRLVETLDAQKLALFQDPFPNEDAKTLRRAVRAISTKINKQKRRQQNLFLKLLCKEKELRRLVKGVNITDIMR